MKQWYSRRRHSKVWEIERNWADGPRGVPKCRTFKEIGRKVPMFASLKTTLQEWRKQNPDTIYVVGTLRGDHPNNHWLDALKHFAREAGLNCGVCDSCTLRNECEKFYLHRFRHTFAHRCLRSGRGIHTVSKDLGHHDLSITSIYLSGSSDENGKDPFAGAA